jgi:hypothetical protein
MGTLLRYALLPVAAVALATFPVLWLGYMLWMIHLPGATALREYAASVYFEVAGITPLVAIFAGWTAILLFGSLTGGTKLTRDSCVREKKPFVVLDAKLIVEAAAATAIVRLAAGARVCVGAGGGSDR